MEIPGVFFVREGTWGTVTQVESTRYLEQVAAVVADAKRRDPNTKEEVARAVVRIIDGVESPEFKQALEYGLVNVLVFNSRSQIELARRFKKQNPRIRVVVLTGLIPDDEIIILHKGWLNSRDAMADHIVNF